MLIETISEGKYLDPDYWNGHSTGDDCPVLDEMKPFGLSDRKVQMSTLHKLREFFAHDIRFPYRRYDVGQTFDAHDFDPGTMVRFLKELYLVGSEIPAQVYTHWGVVSDFEHKKERTRGIAHVVHRPLMADGIVTSINPMLYYWKHAEVRVGAVDHEKVGLSLGDKLVMPSETLERITMLEIMEAADSGKRSTASPTFVSDLVPKLAW